MIKDLLDVIQVGVVVVCIKEFGIYALLDYLLGKTQSLSSTVFSAL